MRKDKQLTAAAKFLNPRSYMAPDGREILYGLDWKARIAELRERSDGRCERMVKWREMRGAADGWWERKGEARCRSEAQDPHHKIKRSKQRDDRLSNLEALCRLHHELEDERKIRSDKADRRKHVHE